MPVPPSSRARACAAPHASITTRAGSRFAKKLSIWLLVNRRRSLTRPGSDETATSKTFLAMSNAIVVCFSRDSSFPVLPGASDARTPRCRSGALEMPIASFAVVSRSSPLTPDLR